MSGSTTYRKVPELRTYTVARRNLKGEVLSEVALQPGMFGLEPNIPVMHQVVVAQLAAARKGTHSTLRQREVRGGGAKPFRQKGTGRARQGSIRASQFVGGGVAHGPKPRSYRQHTPKKMVKLALYSAMSDRAAEGKVAWIDRWSFDVPSTKDAGKALATLELDGRLLVVLGPSYGDIAEMSLRNIPRVQIVQVGELNAYDVLCSDWLVFDDASMARLTGISEFTGAEMSTLGGGEDTGIAGDEGMGEDPATGSASESGRDSEETRAGEGGHDEAGVGEEVEES
ncbi:MAG: 50S ribosomal protein L4 [Actinobacteria bacterium]|nr:50S ribosomal protein L4 [Actinomycetota bacterium]MCL5446602.1 50S ribosomal protein L4 [Actinomycetota bacterium]